MRTLRPLLVGLFMVSTALCSSAFAGDQPQHVIDPGALAAAVADHAASQDADRDAIRQALSRPELKELAAKTGLDLERATAAVGTLGGADLERAAATARQLNESLTGGANLMINEETLIIVLLVVLLIIVAVR